MQFHRVTTRRKGLYGKLVPTGTLLPGVSTTVRPVNPMLGYETCPMRERLESKVRDRRRVKSLFYYPPEVVQQGSYLVRCALSDGLPRLLPLPITQQPVEFDIKTYLQAFPDLPVLDDPEGVFELNHAKLKPGEPYRKQLMQCLLAIRTCWIRPQLLCRPGHEG